MALARPVSPPDNSSSSSSSSRSSSPTSSSSSLSSLSSSSSLLHSRKPSSTTGGGGLGGLGGHCHNPGALARHLAAHPVSRRLWIASFLALTLLFSYSFLDETSSLPWPAAAADAADAYAGDPDEYLLPPLAAAAAQDPAQQRPACVSRAQHPLYLRASRQFPVPEKLRARLAEYEAMHRRCTQGRDWEAELGLVNSSSSASSSGGGGGATGEASECRYLFFIESGGLGNRLLGAVSAFVYSVLTERAMVMSRSSSMAQLLCEPFDNSSWVVPLGFPQSKMMKMQVLMEDSSTQDFSNATVVKLKMQHGQKVHDRRFYCTGTQARLESVKWVTLDTNQYMIPRFFVMPYLWPKMMDLLGDEPTLIFTQLSRYLLLPRNFIWDRILRVYWAYMADAGKRVGLQIRRHSTNFLFDQFAYDRVMRCTIEHGVLPNTSAVLPDPVSLLLRMEPRPVFNLTTTLHRLSEQLLRLRTAPATAPLGSRRAGAMMALVLGRRGGRPGSVLAAAAGISTGSTVQNAAADAVAMGRPTSVLIASLNPEYADEMRRQYGNNPTADGSIVRVVQVSSDKSQSFDLGQLADAFTEMWLLALSDHVATSGWSTFGYIAHGIGGLPPLIVDLKGSAARHKPGEPACWPGPSREPCCHFPFLQSVCALDPSAPSAGTGSSGNATEPVEPEMEAGMGPEQAAWTRAHIRACVDETKGVQLVDHVDEADRLPGLV